MIYDARFTLDDQTITITIYSDQSLDANMPLLKAMADGVVGCGGTAELITHHETRRPL